MIEQAKDTAQGDATPVADKPAQKRRGPKLPPRTEAPAFSMLQEAVVAAEKEAASKVETVPAPVAEPIITPEIKAVAPASVSVAPIEAAVAHKPAKRSRHSLAYAAALTLALGLGAASGWSGAVLWSAAAPRLEVGAASLASGQPMVDRSGTAFGIRRSELDAARLAGEFKTLRSGLDSLRDAVERAKQEQAGRLAQIGERIERSARNDQDTAQKLASLSERLEHSEREPAKVASAPERQAPAAAPLPPAAPAPVAKVASAAPDGPIQTGAIPDAKPKPAVVDGWVLRDVDDGVALIEGRNQRLLEVGPGDTVPGAGRVELIERRGKAWVVVTSKGIIAAHQP